MEFTKEVRDALKKAAGTKVVVIDQEASKVIVYVSSIGGSLDLVEQNRGLTGSDAAAYASEMATKHTAEIYTR